MRKELYRLDLELLYDDDGAECRFYSPRDGAGVVLRGLGASIMRALRPALLKGPRTRAELARLSGTDARTAREFLAVLEEKGLLLRGPAPKRAAGPSGAVGVAGEGPLAQRLRERLGALGLRVTRNGSAALLVFADETLDVGRHLELNLEAARRGRRFLSARLVGSVLELGPLTLPGCAACFECYWRRLQAAPPPRAPLGRGEPAFYDAAALHVALEARRVLEGGAPPLSLGRVVEHDISALTAVHHPLHEVPGCPACAAAPAR